MERNTNGKESGARPYDAETFTSSNASSLDVFGLVMESLGQEEQSSEGASSLQTELKTFLESGATRSEAEAMELGKFLKAAAAFFNQEISALRSSLEQTTAERDKLYNDVLEANNRAQMLAQEIDDRHANLEKESLNLMRNLEAKHSEQLKSLQEQLEAERELSATKWQQEKEEFLRQISVAKEFEMQLKVTIDSLQKDNDKLLKELGTMNDLINSLEVGKLELERELEAYIVAQGADKGDKRDGADGQTSPSVIAFVVEENRRLRDMNDELQAELESTKTRMSRSKSSDLSRSTHSFARHGSSTDGDSDSENRHSGLKKMKRRSANSESLTDLQSGFDDDPFGQSGDQSIATQLFMAKRSNSFESLSKLKGKLVKVLEKWKAQFLDETVDSSSAETIRGKHESFLLELENKLIEAAATESALVAQLEDMKQKYEQLQDIQQEECAKLSASLAASEQRLLKIEETVDHAIKQELKPFQQSLEDQRNRVEGKCQELNARIDEAAEFVGKALEAEQSLAVIRREKVDVLVKISELESHLSDLLNSFNVASPETIPIDTTAICDKTKCNEVKSELDRVKAEILKIIAEKEQLSKEKVEKKEVERVIEERVRFETELLQKRIRDLNQTMVEAKEKREKEKKDLEKRIQELETGMDRLKEEYDNLDDYWQQKIDEERVLFDKERDTMDDKFDELQEKIKELEELLSKSEDKSETCSLSTIDERSTFEKQVVDLEEENLALRRQLEFYQAESSRVQFEEILSTTKLQEELESLKSETQYDRFNYETELESYKVQIAQLKEKTKNLEAQNSEASYETRISELISEKEAMEARHKLELKNLENNFRAKLEFYGEVSKEVMLRSGDQLFHVEHRSDSMLCKRASSPVPFSSHMNRLPVLFSRPPPTMCNKLVKPLTINGRTACKIELSVLQSLNSRLRQQDERVKQLEMALKFQQQATEKLMHETKLRHESEISHLERVMQANQELLNQQLARYHAQTEKLVAADSLVQQLYCENTMLVQALDTVRSTLSVTVCI